jgi:hypothetical protein
VPTLTFHVPKPDDDEPESESGARDVHERAMRMLHARGRSIADTIPTAGDPISAMAGMVAQLAACVTCYIEDNERRLAAHEISNAGDVTRLANLEQWRVAAEHGTDGPWDTLAKLRRRLDRAEGVLDRLANLERVVEAVKGQVRTEDDGCVIEQLHHRLRAVEAGTVDTRSPAWQEAYDQGYEAGQRAFALSLIHDVAAGFPDGLQVEGR